MHISRRHSLGIEEAKLRVEKVAADIGGRFNLTYAWDGDILGFRGSGVDGQIAVTDDSVDIRIKLGFALMMLQGAIRQAIESSIDEYVSD